jgi:hypothetical protein
MVDLQLHSIKRNYAQKHAMACGFNETMFVSTEDSLGQSVANSTSELGNWVNSHWKQVDVQFGTCVPRDEFIMLPKELFDNTRAIGKRTIGKRVIGEEKAIGEERVIGKRVIGK